MRTHLMLNPLRILVVERHPFQLLAIQMLLNRLGYYLLAEAMDAEDAKRVMTSSSATFDLLLCDHHLADMSGARLIEWACNHDKIRSAILVSRVSEVERTNLTRETRIKAPRLLACLEKPVDREKLQQLIALHLLPQEQNLTRLRQEDSIGHQYNPQTFTPLVPLHAKNLLLTHRARPMCLNWRTPCTLLAL
ncbi:response regulator [Pseudomonas sp. GZD-222]|uniref:response regulator n=1 Tax=Pseudomonas sp. GZD-222 TaxID=3404805 RepID=UPI003BB4B972